MAIMLGLEKRAVRLFVVTSRLGKRFDRMKDVTHFGVRLGLIGCADCVEIRSENRMRLERHDGDTVRTMCEIGRLISTVNEPFGSTLRSALVAVQDRQVGGC